MRHIKAESMMMGMMCMDSMYMMMRAQKYGSPCFVSI